MPNFSMTGNFDLQSHVPLLDKSIDLVWNRRDQIEVFLKRFFKQTKATGGTEYKIDSISSLIGLPRVNEDSDDLPRLVSAPGFGATYTFINYRSGLQVTRAIVESDRFGQIMESASGLAKSAVRKDEFLRANPLNNGFSSQTTADGVALFSNSHLQENPEIANGDNLGTGALSGPNLQAIRLVLKQHVNEIGVSDPVKAMVLLVTENDEQKALELTRAPKRAEDNLNAPTVLIGSLEVVVSTFLTDADAFFLMGDRTGNQMGLHEITLAPWTIANNRPANVDIVLDKRIRARKVIATHDWRNLAGSQGS